MHHTRLLLNGQMASWFSAKLQRIAEKHWLIVISGAELCWFASRRSDSPLIISLMPLNAQAVDLAALRTLPRPVSTPCKPTSSERQPPRRGARVVIADDLDLRWELAPAQPLVFAVESNPSTAEMILSIASGAQSNVKSLTIAPRWSMACRTARRTYCA